MDNLNAEKINGSIRLKLKNGKTMIGNLPFESADNSHIIFLPYENWGTFNKILNGRKTLIFNEIQQLVLIIYKNDIESYELMETKINGFNVGGTNKPIPDSLKITVKNNNLPGHVEVQYQIPGTNKFHNFGELPIENGFINLPLKIVFLSYAKKDKEIVLHVMDKLHDKGVITWFDESNLFPGDNWEEIIEESIENSDFVLIFLSTNSMNDDGYKNKEIHIALNQYLLKASRKRYIIPFLLDDCKPPREFNKIQWLKMSDENWLEKLLVAVGSK